jgi:hypothetical protein
LAWTVENPPIESGTRTVDADSTPAIASASKHLLSNMMNLHSDIDRWA